MCTRVFPEISADTVYIKHSLREEEFRHLIGNGFKL